MWDLQRLFNAKVDLNVDERKAETTFAFIGPMPAKKQGPASNQKSKKQKKAAEEGDDCDSELESEKDQEEENDKDPDEGKKDSESDEDYSATITLKGNQTCIPKIHAFGYLTECIECHGNHDIGSTSMYECYHRRGKRYIKHSNLNQTKTLQGQILLNSVTEAAETPSRAVQSARARVFYEENSNGTRTVNGPTIVPDDESSEDEGDNSHVHLGAGIILCTSTDNILLVNLFTYSERI